MAKRRNFSPDFKAKVELASRYQVHPNIVTKWKREALSGLKESFAKGSSRTRNDHEAEIKTLQAKVGELVVERDFLAKAFDR